jgi:integration host factor subunit beta
MKKSLSKSEIIETLANKFNLSADTSKYAVNSILNKMSNAFASGNRVEIRRFGSFTVQKHEPRKWRNPKTGKSMNIEAQYLIHFKPGEPLRNKINTYFEPKV